VTVGTGSETEIALERGRVTLDIDVVDNHFDPPQAFSDTRIRIEADVFDADVSASGGSVSLNVPVNARYSVVAMKDGYDGTRHRVTVREEARSIAVTAQRNPELTLSAANDRVIVGESTRIELTNAYGEPATGVEVRMDGEVVGETDERGEVSIRIDAVGERTVVANDGRVESNPTTVTGLDPDTDSASPTETIDDDTPEATSEDTPEDSPGFGILAAAAAVLLSFALRAKRQ
jgi:hypothetical protein